MKPKSIKHATNKVEAKRSGMAKANDTQKNDFGCIPNIDPKKFLGCG